MVQIVVGVLIATVEAERHRPITGAVTEAATGTLALTTGRHHMYIRIFQLDVIAMVQDLIMRLILYYRGSEIKQQS